MTEVWSHLFMPGAPVWEKVIRAIVVYAFLIVGLRLSGKRELAQLNPFDLVVLLTLSNTVQNAIIGEDNSLLGGLIGATALLVVNYFVVRFMFFHPRVERIIEGHPVGLVESGKVQERKLREELISVTELRAAAHRQGFEHLRDVETAVLEPGGTICFTRKEPSVEAARYQEVLARLDKLSAEIQTLRENWGQTPRTPISEK
ncbi:MAG TPA: YetF domain-containing protein [Terriglobia bacterium]|nr:YetF domain-containing protein [Terriglobia bacterium]